jgi:NAD(P)-dependent dehydrogenase (short-subunit alcohol dehydrogenase family)
MVDTMPEEVQQALGDSVPFPNRLGRPEEFAALAVQLIENAYFNGATIRLDGAIRLEPK